MPVAQTPAHIAAVVPTNARLLSAFICSLIDKNPRISEFSHGQFLQTWT
jgi:hypothetical protein